MAPLFIYSSTRVTNNETGMTTCSVFLPDEDQRSTYVIFTLYNLLASFAIPLVFIIIFYTQVRLPKPTSGFVLFIFPSPKKAMLW